MGDNFYNKQSDNLENDIVFGVRAVIEAVRAGKEINKIMIQRGMQKTLFKELKEELADKKYNLQFVPIQKLNRLTRKNHQGVIAFIAPIQYQDIEAITTRIFEEGGVPNFLILDSITDVRNFGAIARTAECTGIDAIVIVEKGGVLVTSDSIKTSAGALMRIPVCVAKDLSAVVSSLKSSGVQVVACTEKTQTFIQDVELDLPTAIIMGSEEDGISNELLAAASYKAKIPMQGDIASLNVAVAAGMIMYESLRQRLG
ncbi:23S rRNA (guanosine(2251)-2'-O)-methyltransferase RlmB [Putridiphycobacter roseus]|uniref:23S rRNA (Guanosine(2251)-2'-O)-methyltransferase RlmB n=1 Tax=Putridiphycobacter roseus TaxID=2219161 RepID=A0A2W1NAV2_9FLAO|nr:23S rRNA (guanosine(2251)-2'-O)-methyltransferase RlmB [Putridiphycobacter roseus]PZE16395.1 23S rRNA (guanosine(2251)-2'-O)-methyltransferase RlmB [Putridiphycobacter roseus]